MDQTPADSTQSFPFVRADINDTHRLYATLEEHGVDSIIHCGAVSGRVVQGDNPFMLLETNVRGTAQVFEAARHVGIKRIVFCSSSAAYGKNVPDPLTEDARLDPTTLYGSSKACGEAILRGYAEDYGIDGVALRIFQVFGPGRTTPCYVRELISNALNGHPTKIAHSPSSRRQYVYAEDVVDAILLALDRPNLPRRAYNVAPDSSLTLAEVVETVKSIVPGVTATFGSDPEGDQYMIRSVDLSIAKNELGYYPKVSFRDGVTRYAEWLQNT
jgi:nucleoside-diphosphate-sugar epimerase